MSDTDLFYKFTLTVVAIGIVFATYVLFSELEKDELLKDKERVDWMIENSNLTREYIDNAMGK